MSYPASDRTLTIDFGDDGPFGPFAADLTFSSADQTVSFIVTRGALKGKAETLPFAATEIRSGLWLVTWQEADLLTVVQVQDFEANTVTSAVTTADQQFVMLNGRISLG